MRISGIILSVVMLLASSVFSSAQQNLWQGEGIRSLEVDASGRVTFRLYAPDAGEVAVTGDFLQAGVGSAAMTRDDSGVWSYTTEPLASEMYYYSFKVGGVGDIHDPESIYMVRDVGRYMNYFIVGGGRGDLYMAQDVGHGSVARVWADVGGVSRRMVVYTPAGYETSDREYPVLYLLHGMGGDEEAWLATGRAAEIMDNLIATGRAEEMIVVMTNGCTRHVSAPGYSHEGMWRPYMSGSMDGSFEEMFEDVVNWVDGCYRTQKCASRRAIAGLSMGGFHAMQISKRYPAMFDYVGLFSAAIFRGESGVAMYEDLEPKLKNQFDNGVELYWIAIGRNDFLYEENVKYRELLDNLDISYTYYESDGGHEWRNWRCYLVEFAQKIFKK